MRIAIMGTGSLGTILGAHIAKAGYQIDLIDSFEGHVEALNKGGATVTGTRSFCVPVRALTPERMDGQYDLIFFMVKQICNESAIAAIKPHIHDRTAICTLQNGLPEPVLAEAFNADMIFGCIVGWGATFLGPGVSELTSSPKGMSFDLGRIDGKITCELIQIRNILESMCPVNLQENLTGMRWSKLLINSTFSAMSTLTGCRFGEVYEQPDILRCAQHLGNECLRTAVASNIRVERSQGLDVSALLPFSTESEREKTAETYRLLGAHHRLLRASMLQDLEKGRKCEIDYINGVICTEGRKNGIATPVNDQIVELIHGIEAGRLIPEYHNVKLISLPE